ARSWSAAVLCRFFRDNSKALENFSLAYFLKSEFNSTIGLQRCPSSLRPPALHVHSDRIARDMRPRRLNMHCQRRRIATQTLRPNPRLIDGIEQLFFQSRYLGIGIF